MWLTAGFWGLLSGSALVIGAAAGYFLKLRKQTISFVMAFGSGVLVSALSFDLMDVAYKEGGFFAVSVGFLIGAVIYTLASNYLNSRGAKNRKRSSRAQMSETEKSGSGLAIALGALLDGIPESIVIGISILSGKGVSVVAVAAVFVSNIPEGLSSASGMRKSGRSARYVFTVWGAIALLSGLGSLVGYAVFGGFPIEVTAATTAVAAGAILAMLVTTMIPEANEGEHEWAGLVTVLGFLVAFVISKIGEL